MNEEQLKDHLVNIIKQYTSQWNTIEDRIYNQYQQEESELREKYPSDEYHYATRTNWFEQFTNLISPLFDEYCTDKKRVYGGKIRKSFGFPVKFRGIEVPTEVKVILKNKNRAEVYIKTETNFMDEYLFVLLRRSDVWKIDSYKNRRYGNEQWDNQIL